MLDPNEAPEGYVAVGYLAVDACDKCAFSLTSCSHIPCRAFHRADKTDVYFAQKPEMSFEEWWEGYTSESDTNPHDYTVARAAWEAARTTKPGTN